MHKQRQLYSNLCISWFIVSEFTWDANSFVFDMWERADAVCFAGIFLFSNYAISRPASSYFLKNKMQKEEKILFSPFLKQFEIFYFLLYCTWFRAVLNRFLQVFILHIMFHFMQELHSNIGDLFPCDVVIQNSVFYSISLSGYFDCKSA